MANESESETNIFQLSPAAATKQVPPSTTPIAEDSPHASLIAMGCVSPKSSPVKQEHIPLESEIGRWRAHSDRVPGKGAGICARVARAWSRHRRRVRHTVGK